MSLHINYRPNTFAEVEGNLTAVESLQAIMGRKTDVPHVVLFTGDSGCGKTTLGRIFAKEIGCSDVDFREIDSADFRGIDSIREIRSQSQKKPFAGKVRVWLLDECHKMTGDAQSALLKILEDTPSHVYFILCTTDPQKLLKTIRSRCMQFAVAPLTERQMTRLLKRVVELEKVVDFPENAYKLIHKKNAGRPREALITLDKIIDLPPEKILKSIEQAGEEEAQTIDLCRLLIKRASWKEISAALRNLPQGTDFESVRWAVIGYSNAVLTKDANIQAYICIDAFKEPYFNTGKAGLTASCFAATMID